MSHGPPVTSFRLDGLEPDNLLAFLALLGLLQLLEEADRSAAPDLRWRPRVSWTVDEPPWRPRLHVARPVGWSELVERLEETITRVACLLDFDQDTMPRFPLERYAELVEAAFGVGPVERRLRLGILAALATDIATEGGERRAGDRTVVPTPLCLLSGQGHQDFLPRLRAVPVHRPLAERRGSSKTAAARSKDVGAALFGPWTRRDDLTLSFRWDPEETPRQALMAGDPTDEHFKLGTELGANRLAVFGLWSLPVVAGGAGPVVPGGRETGAAFALAWPIWREPASLETIRALLLHPELRAPGALAHLGVVQVMEAPIVRLGRYRNVLRAEPLREAT